MACLGFSDVGKMHMLWELDQVGILVTKDKAIVGCKLQEEFPGHLQVVQDALVGRNRDKITQRAARLHARAQNMKMLRSRNKKRSLDTS